MNRNPELDSLFNDATLWRQEALQLRELLLMRGLREELKWKKPCYTYDSHNICIIQRMKGFLALLFFKGALLNDPDGILEVQGPNSRAGYRIRFTSIEDVKTKSGSVNSCVQQAIAVEQAGLTVKAPAAADIRYPQELITRFDEDPAYKTAFDNLTAGRKRGYVLHFTDAKQSKTRQARIEKVRSKVLQGKGFNERV